MTTALALTAIAGVLTTFALGRRWEILSDRAEAIPPIERRRIDSDYAQLVDRRDAAWWGFLAAIAFTILAFTLLAIVP